MYWAQTPKRGKTGENKAQNVDSGPEVAILGPQQKKLWNLDKNVNLLHAKFTKYQICFLVPPQNHGIFGRVWFVRWELNQIGEGKETLN